MTRGSCVCGDFAYELTGEPLAKVACHCIPCRKTSGTPGSYNLMYPEERFKLVRGTPKKFARKGDSGGDVTYNNCPTCSTLLWVEADSMQGLKIVKMGGLDDKEFVENLGMPTVEIYCKNTTSWEKGWEGAKKAQASK